MLLAAFEHRQWARTYLRNNKSNGKKNLRCFPQCSPDGHAVNSFCGTSIEVRVSRPPDFQDDICVVGAFGLAGEPRWAMGTSISKPELDGLLSNEEIFRAGDKDLSRRLFTFAPKGWGYLAKTSPQLEHAFHAYVLQIISSDANQTPGETSFRVVKVLSTARFRITGQRPSSKRVGEGAEEPSSSHYPRPSVSPVSVSDQSTVAPASSSPPITTAATSPAMSTATLEQASSSALPPHHPFIEMIPLRAEDMLKRKRSAGPKLSYADFLGQFPGDLQAFISESFASLKIAMGLQAALVPAAAAVGESEMSRLVTVDDIEHVLPLGVNLRLLLTPVPMQAGDECPDLSGSYELSNAILLSDVEMMPKTKHLPKWALAGLLSRAVSPSERLVRGWQTDWNSFEAKFPSNVLSVSNPFRFTADAQVRDFTVFGPMATSMTLSTQVWTVGPVLVCRCIYPDEDIGTRVDRCLWKKEDGSLALLFIYQSIRGRGWGGEILDHGLALMQSIEHEGWVINTVMFGEMRACTLS